jgi:hypothetical protein
MRWYCGRSGGVILDALAGAPPGLLLLVLWGVAILSTGKMLESEVANADNEQDNA